MADVELIEPNQLVQFIDRDGRLTAEGWLLLSTIIAYLRELDARLTALEP